jgi:hypothetical protein
VAEPLTNIVTTSALDTLVPPRIPVEAGVPRRELNVSQEKILYVSVPATIPRFVRLTCVVSIELIVTVVAVLATPAIAPPVELDEEIRNILPSAAPLVIAIRYGVAGLESAPGDHPAFEFVIEFEENAEITPEACPVIDAASRRGGE